MRDRWYRRYGPLCLIKVGLALKGGSGNPEPWISRVLAGLAGVDVKCQLDTAANREYCLLPLLMDINFLATYSLAIEAKSPDPTPSLATILLRHKLKRLRPARIERWSTLVPGDMIYTKIGGHDCLVELEGSRVSKDIFVKKYEVYCKHVDWDGVQCGWKDHTIGIDSFEGTRPITDLKAFPAVYHPSLASLQSDLRRRGEKFQALSGWHHKSYQGLAYRMEWSDFLGDFVRKAKTVSQTTSFLTSRNQFPTGGNHILVHDFDTS